MLLKTLEGKNLKPAGTTAVYAMGARNYKLMNYELQGTNSSFVEPGLSPARFGPPRPASFSTGRTETLRILCVDAFPDTEFTERERHEAFGLTRTPAQEGREILAHAVSRGNTAHLMSS